MLRFMGLQESRKRNLMMLYLILIISATVIFIRLINLSAARSAGESARNIYYDEALNAESETDDKLSDEKDVEDESPSPHPQKNPSIVALQEINPDVSGWIQIPGTRIDHPIVQANDNLFYLDHTWRREKNRSGAVFMDYRNDPDAFEKTGTHTILYGHNMRDGSMFHNLNLYKDLSFFENNRTIQISDLYRKHTFEIFSVYITSTDFYYIDTDFESQHDFVQFLSLIKDKSIHPKEFDLSAQDHLLTLSTCTYELQDARLVIHARRIETLEERSDTDG